MNPFTARRLRNPYGSSSATTTPQEKDLDSTITEKELDAASAHFVQGFREDARDAEPDLSVDGLSESFLMRLLRSLTVRRSH